MRAEERRKASRTSSVARGLAFALTCGLFAPGGATAQGPGTEDGQWAYLGGDAWHTRYTTADQLDPSNFEQLEVVWQWNATSFGPATARATPSLVGGKLITVAGNRRHVVALDPATGELLWSFREPNTYRYEYSMRKGYGKGVAYAEIDGRGVVFITSPGFFLHALDADTGQPLEGWGRPVPLDGFGPTGTVDLVEDLIADWGPWTSTDRPYDPFIGIPREIGYITASSPPIVVNDTVVVGNSAEQGYLQTRVENVPGDILAYDTRTGDFKWKFHVIPRPGEFGHETWENDAWQWIGDVSSWAPMSADPELGLVYVVTNGPTIDYYGGHHPGDNLFSTSIIALDADTGERRWHYQMVHHDIWNYDTPTAPVLMDVTVDGREVKGLFQATKQAFLYALDRETGEPLWPIEEQPVPASRIPGEKLSATQPFPTRPAPYDLQGRTEDHLIDYTPEIKQMARQVALDNDLFNGLFDPPTHTGDPAGPAWNCPGGGGGTNITGPAVGDPTTGVLFVSSQSGCFRLQVMPGVDSPLDELPQSGTTHTDWAAVATTVRGSIEAFTLDGLPIWKGPIGRITAIDMNTGEHLWVTPNGDAPRAAQDRIRNHPLVQGLDGVEINRGRGGNSAMVVTPTMLLAGGQTADDTPHLFAIDKRTGERLGAVEIPGLTRYGMSSWMHKGRQFVIVQLRDGLAAMALPVEDAAKRNAYHADSARRRPRLPGEGDDAAKHNVQKVSGTVVAAATQQPVANARVQYVESGQVPQTKETDANGNFEFLAGRLGVVTVTAGDDFGVARRKWSPSVTSLRVELVPPAIVRGTVSARVNNQPLTAIVTVMVQHPGNFVSHTVNAEDGAFTVDDLPPGPALVTARSAGFAPYIGSITVESGKDHVAPISLLREARATGHVQDAAGAAVTGALVSATYPDLVESGILEGFVGGRLLTAGGGEFALHGLVPNTPIYLQAELDGRRSAPTTITIAPGEQEDVVLTLP